MSGAGLSAASASVSPRSGTGPDADAATSCADRPSSRARCFRSSPSRSRKSPRRPGVDAVSASRAYPSAASISRPTAKARTAPRSSSLGPSMFFVSLRVFRDGRPKRAHYIQTAAQTDKLVLEQAVALDRLVVLDGDPQGLGGADDDAQLLGPRQRRIKKVALEHDEVL